MGDTGVGYDAAATAESGAFEEGQSVVGSFSSFLTLC